MKTLRTLVSVLFLTMMVTGCFTLGPFCCGLGPTVTSEARRWNFESAGCTGVLCGFAVVSGRAELVAEVHPGEHSLAIWPGATVEASVDIRVADRGTEILRLLVMCEGDATLTATELLVVGSSGTPMSAPVRVTATDRWSQQALALRMGTTGRVDSCSVVNPGDEPVFVSTTRVRALRLTVTGARGRCIIDDVSLHGSAFAPSLGFDGGTESGADVPLFDSGRDARLDTGVRDVVMADAGTSNAGEPCTDDSMCGSLRCDRNSPGGICSGECENNPSQTMERAMCGGNGSTCLTQGDALPLSRCTRACSPSAPTSECRANQICTGFWFSHAGSMPDRSGCTFFCHSDMDCNPGSRCDRLGSCVTTVPAATNQPDGTYCNPLLETAGAPSLQCRGACFLFSNTDRTQGICGSLVDTRRAPEGACPDGDPNVSWRAAGGGTTDNLGICIFRSCRCDRDCGVRLECVEGLEIAVCTFPNLAMGEHGTPDCPPDDAGRDVVTDAADDVAPPDADAIDVLERDSPASDGATLDSAID